MQTVGYKLVKSSDDSVIESWGGIWGQLPNFPNTIVLPNGDHIISPQLETDYSGHKIIEWQMDAPAPNVPLQVPLWAVRVVLINNNLLGQAQAAIDASTDIALKTLWEYGNFANRNSAAISLLAKTLNLTDAQVDQFFIDANNLSV